MPLCNRIRKSNETARDLGVGVVEAWGHGVVIHPSSSQALLKHRNWNWLSVHQHVGISLLVWVYAKVSTPMPAITAALANNHGTWGPSVVALLPPTTPSSEGGLRCWGWERLFQRTMETGNCTYHSDKASWNEPVELTPRLTPTQIPGGNKREKVSFLGAKRHCKFIPCVKIQLCTNPILNTVLNRETPLSAGERNESWMPIGFLVDSGFLTSH